MLRGTKREQKKGFWVRGRRLILVATAAVIPGVVGITAVRGDTLVWDNSGTADYFSANWYDQNLGVLTTPGVEDDLAISNGATITWTGALGQSIVLSSTSASGRSLNI